MKKFAKVMLILACVFLAVGIGFAAAGAAMGASVGDTELSGSFGDGLRRIKNMTLDNDFDFDWDLDDVSDTGESSGDTRKYTVDAAEEMKIDLLNDELILQTHEGENIIVEVENDTSQNVKVDSSSKKVEIESTKRKNNRRIIVSYPAGHSFSKIDINVGAGSVSIQDELYADELDVEIGAGELVNETLVTVGILKVEVGAGSAEITDVKADKIDGECGIGSLYISIRGQETDYNYKLECGIGDISIDGESYSGLAKEKKITNAGASGEIDLECGIGEIEIEFE